MKSASITTKAPERFRLPAVLLIIALVSFSAAGCVKTNPYLREEVGEELRRATAFDTGEVVREPARRLDDLPLEPEAKIFGEAKSAVSPTPGIPAVSMSLQDARKQALENNLGLKVDLYNPAVAEQRYIAEQGKFEAVLGATVQYSGTKAPPGNTSTTLSTTPSVNIPTRAGGAVTLSLPYSKATTGGLFAGLGPVYNTGVDLSVNQPLLRGAGWELNRASIDIAGLQLRQADSRMKLSAIRLLANVEKAYWGYYASYEDLKIQIRRYELAQDQVRMATRMFEEGVRTKVEVTRAELGVARQFEAIIRAENLRRQSERALKRFVNSPDLPLKSMTIVRPVTPAQAEQLVFDREKVIGLSFKNRMELFENELQLEIDRITVGVNRNATLPDIVFNFTYSFKGSQPTFSDSIKQLFKNDLNGYVAGLSIQVPLQWNEAARARLKSSVLSQKQTRAVRMDLESAVSQEVLNAVDSLEHDWQRILSTRMTVALAEETYEAEMLQFQYGLGTMTDLLIALSNLSDAKSAHIQAIRDYQNSLVDLAFATGTVLGSSGVVWTPESNSPLQ